MNQTIISYQPAYSDIEFVWLKGAEIACVIGPLKTRFLLIPDRDMDLTQFIAFIDSQID